MTALGCVLMTNNELKLIKENSRLKLGIAILIEEMTGNKEYRDIRKFLEDILVDNKEKLNKESFLERWEKKQNESS